MTAIARLPKDRVVDTRVCPVIKTQALVRVRVKGDRGMSVEIDIRDLGYLFGMGVGIRRDAKGHPCAVEFK